MVTHVDVQISALVLGLSYYTGYEELDEYETSIEECEKLAETDPGKAVKNVHTFGFFLTAR